MRLCMMLPPKPDRRWTVARQMGVTAAIAKLAPELTGRPPLDFREQKRNNVPVTFHQRRRGMLKIFVEEAAALASITLFVGMIAVWAGYA